MKKDFMVAFGFIIAAMVVIAIGFQVVRQRIEALESQQQFHGYLYTLNPSTGLWDRLQTGHTDLCSSQPCIVFFGSQPSQGSVDLKPLERK